MQTAQDLTLLDGGAEAFPRMVLAIEQARESVQLEMYLFRLDATGRRFVAALSAAAARGVTVRVSLDGWGSSQDAREIKAELVAAGCAVSIQVLARVVPSPRAGAQSSQAPPRRRARRVRGRHQRGR